MQGQGPNSFLTADGTTPQGLWHGIEEDGTFFFGLPVYRCYMRAPTITGTPGIITGTLIGTIPGFGDLVDIWAYLGNSSSNLKYAQGLYGTGAGGASVVGFYVDPADGSVRFYGNTGGTPNQVQPGSATAVMEIVVFFTRGK